MIKMESKYQCPYCQYMSLRKWNVQNHVRNAHRIYDFPNGSNEEPNLNQQNIRPREFVLLNSQNGSNEKMKCKYLCPYCQYMSLKKWNVQKHVRNVHRIKDFPNGSNEKQNIDRNNEKPNIKQQNIRPREYVHSYFPNGSNEKPSINQQNIRPTEFHSESDCKNHKSRELLQKIGAEIALLLYCNCK